MNLESLKTSVSNLKHSIHEIRRTSSRELYSFEKKQHIAIAVLDSLAGSGAFYQADDGLGYYFENSSGELQALNENTFHRLLSDMSGLNVTETEFKYALEHLQTETIRRGRKTTVYPLSHYDQKQRKLYVTNFRGGMWVLDGEKVLPAPNGQDGVLFVASPFATSYQYLPDSKRLPKTNLWDFLEPISCDPQSALAEHEVKNLLYTWLLSMFFPEENPTKIIPAFIGAQGSTKTSTARRFGIQLMGEHFNVGHLEASERGEAAFIATICGKFFASFDNADMPCKWLPDRLATLATGQNFELRRLYTTNELQVSKPKAYVVLTSRDPHFRRPDVAERLLIVKLTRPQHFIPESRVIKDLMRCRDSVWSNLLDDLNDTLLNLEAAPKAPDTKFRMADFASFGWRISVGAEGNEIVGNNFYETLKKLEKEQASYAVEEDSVTTCLAIWLSTPSNYDRSVDTGALFRELEEIAKAEGLMLTRTSAAFGKRLWQAKKAIEMALSITISSFSTTHTSRWRFQKLGSVELSETFTQTALPSQPTLLEEPPW